MILKNFGRTLIFPIDNMNQQKSFENDAPTLYIVATPIGNLSELTPRAKEVLESVDVIAAEDTRNTMKLLSHFQISTHLIAHHKFNETASSKGIIQLLQEGKDVAVVSDAGYPLISDPGSELVRLVIDAGYPVVPISGSNAMLNALVASGLSPQPFLFYGFLPSNERQRIKELQSLKHQPMTLIFYEAPHRIEKMLTNCLEVLGDRPMCLARELTKKHEEFLRGTIREVLQEAANRKGEMVVLIAGHEEDKEQDVTQAMPLLKDHIQNYISEGMSTNEAIKRVARERGLSKNEIYKEYHGLN